MKRSPFALLFVASVACSSNGAAPAASADATADAAASDAGSDAAQPESSIEPDAAVAPCTAAASCVGRLTLPGSTWQIPYYATFPVDRPNAQVTRVVVFNQGLNRDAATDFSTMVTAAQTAGVLDSTLVVTPDFQALVGTDGAACSGHVDAPAANDAVWTCDAWSDGLAAVNAPTITSYGAIDAILRALAASHPNVTRTTIAGFSAGGQLTQRYAAVNAVDPGAAGAFRYVVGSPSSYLYFDTQRPVNASSCTATGCPDGFAAFTGAASCAGYNDWKYGTDALEGAAATVSPSAMKAAYLSRDVTYLLAALDDGPTTAADYAQLDVTCAANAQGPYRLQRGLAHRAYATSLGAKPSLFVVPGCGHSPSCVFESSVGVGAVFDP